MADIICRWRNATPKTVCELVNNLPHEEMPSNQFREIMGDDFFHTPYQLACQLGLYLEDDNSYFPRFNHDITEDEAEQYLYYWIQHYYVPNPFTRSLKGLDEPVYLIKSIIEYLEKNGNSAKFVDVLQDIFHDPMGNLDIVTNLVNKYSRVLTVKNEIISLVPNYKQIMMDIIDRTDKKSFFDNFSRSKRTLSNLPLQQIWYGAPGTGKSHGVKELTDGMPDENVFRTTFHPDSDYSTFVGCYKPKKEQAVLRDMAGRAVLDPITNEEITEERITYGFEPQAFIKAYIRAYRTDEPVALVIEEINRGNCAQIFGDIFQLLDRKEGVSEYPVKPDSSLNDYLKAVLKDKYDESVGMIIPSNLHIWATMNTSDQSLFPIDSAFKRRWSWKYVPINTRKENWIVKMGDSDYSWSEFLEAVNTEIFETTNSEDKQLGFYFCKAKDGVVDAEMFVNKVLFYLYNDVFKDYGLDRNFLRDENGKIIPFRDFFTQEGDINTDHVKTILENLKRRIIGI